MSYSSMARCANDQSFRLRVQSAAVQEAYNNPANADSDFATAVKTSAANSFYLDWPTAIASDVEQAYEYALNAGIPDPGGDPTVITDGMILANVQAHWPDNPWPPTPV